MLKGFPQSPGPMLPSPIPSHKLTPALDGKWLALYIYRSVRLYYPLVGHTLLHYLFLVIAKNVLLVLDFLMSVCLK